MVRSAKSSISPNLGESVFEHYADGWSLTVGAAVDGS